MQKGQLDYAIRKALDIMDEWNDCTGTVIKFSSYYYELCSVVSDAVKIGVKVAIYGKDADLKNLDSSQEYIDK